MAASEILIVSSDPAFVNAFQTELLGQGFSVHTQETLPELPAALRAHLPQMLVLDLDIAPDPPWDAVSALRLDPHTARLPIVAVSGKHTAPRQVILGLRMGVVEYIPKFCDLKVLTARMQALLQAIRRRKTEEVKEGLLKTSDGRIVLDLSAHRCQLRSESGFKEVRLTPKEFLLLAHLMSRQNRMVSKEEILRFLWPAEHSQIGNLAVLAQYIARIRRKLGPLKVKLKTVWGLGFRWDD